jgi:hypothetical protein
MHPYFKKITPVLEKKEKFVVAATCQPTNDLSNLKNLTVIMSEMP